MNGETDTEKLIRDMRPALREGEFVYCAVSPEELARLGDEPVCVFREEEGVTAILPRRRAEEAGLRFDYRCRMITLQVHSSLAAVGLLAAVTARLAVAGISVNVVSACRHDHLFVPVERAEEALSLLARGER